MTKTRTFIALALPAILRDALVEELAGARESTRGVRWVAAENLHVTLKFYGDVAAPVIEALTQQLSQLETRPFRLVLEGVGAFPSWRRPRVVWVGLTEAESAVMALVEAMERVSSALGFAREARPFRPHLTIGRVRQGVRSELTALQPLTGRRFGVWDVDRLTLFASELRPEGARYRALYERPL